jgi:hypothetical protein
MNYFLQAVKQVLSEHGALGKYIRVSASVYDIETASSTTTDTTYNVRMYEKHVKTSQFNFPNLIGKQVSMFYIAADSLAFVPSVKDVIEFNGTKFTIDSFSEHVAKGQVIMYKIVAIRS